MKRGRWKPIKLHEYLYETPAGTCVCDHILWSHCGYCGLQSRAVSLLVEAASMCDDDTRLQRIVPYLLVCLCHCICKIIDVCTYVFHRICNHPTLAAEASSSATSSTIYIGKANLKKCLPPLTPGLCRLQDTFHQQQL